MYLKRCYSFKQTYILIDGFRLPNYSIKKDSTIYICAEDDVRFSINIHDTYLYKNILYCLCAIDLILEKKYCIIMLDDTKNIFDILYIDYQNPGIFDWVHKICFFEKDHIYDSRLYIHIDDIKIHFCMDSFSFCNGGIFSMLTNSIKNIAMWK